MKYVVILGDGMADYPVDAFDGKTILEVADKPTIDYMAQHGEMGMVKTVQDGMKPGSDVANLSVMGYDTKKCYSGRSPLEAASIGVPLKDNDVTFRCNLVTLSDEENYEDKTMLDYSAGEITTEEAAELIKAVAKELDTDMIKFYPGISYRHLTVWEGGSTNVELTPPHDISDKKITDHLPKGDGADTLLEMMKRSEKILRETLVTPKINKEVVCFIDDDLSKKGRRIHNVPVVGGRNEILQQAEKYHVDEIYIALPSIDDKEVSEILNICKETNLSLKNFLILLVL